MNILLWVLQIALAFLYLSGGGFKAFNPDTLAGQITALPRGAWVALGVFEMVGAIFLIVPAAINWQPSLTALAAALLAFETLALAALYAQSSLKLAATNPLVWALSMGLVAALVAYGRYALRPFG